LAIHLHRSNRSEVLVEMLCQVLGDNWPTDPFLEFPVVVGSRGMERWLRHEVATRMDIAAGLAFPFPRQALTGAARWILGGAEFPDAAFWDMTPAMAQEAQRWEREGLAFELVGLLRQHHDDPDFASVARYLDEGREGAGLTVESAPSAAPPVTARELLFASEVGDVLDRLMHDRPEDSIRWAMDPASAEEQHRWLATLLGDIGAATDAHSPAVLHGQLAGQLAGKGTTPAQATGRTMCIFGLSTMGPGDRVRLAAIARSIEVHLFVLVPTDQWFQHQRTHFEANAARREAQTVADQERVEAELASDNPILISLGAPSRDSQVWLEEVGYEGDQLEAEDPAQSASTTLARLQGWILAAEGTAAVQGGWGFDSTVSAHSTFGALRQCEVLRDELLSMFAADPTLEPRDVVVMTPDIETYAPLVAAVFSRTGLAESGANGPTGGHLPRLPRLPRIPVSIADLGLRRTNPVAEVLLKSLEVAGERLTANWVLDFLALEPVRMRWGLDDDDLADMRQLIRDSGLRWGMDAADREAVDQPPLDQNTVRFAVERLALGVLMPDEDALGVVPDPSGDLAPAVPLEIESRSRVSRVGRLGVILRTLGALRTQLAQPATLKVWQGRLVSALDGLAATSEKSSWLRAEVDAALDDLARVGGRLGGLPVERAAVLRWLEGDFEMPSRGDRVITGAVQVCALEPMRSVPFRVVALLGMDDKAFPRAGRRRTWDPMEQRRRGERDRREIDRHLMLEAMLSARDRLLVLWSGHDEQQGKEQPAAVPVEELLETLGQLTGRARRELVREHPLQPWSPGNFGAVPQSFDRGMATAAVRLREIEVGERAARPLGLAASGTAALPPDGALPEVLEFEDLAKALLRPHQLLLRDRLGLSINREEAAIEDREPLELDGLEAWALRSRTIRHLQSLQEEEPRQAPAEGSGAADPREALVEALRVRVAGEGTLPLRAGGLAILRREVDLAEAVLVNLDDVAGDRADELDIRVKLEDGLLLVGRVEDVVLRDGELLLQWWTPAKAANEQAKMLAWLHLLGAVAAGHGVVGGRIVGHDSRGRGKRAGGDFLVFDGTAIDARVELEGLVELWRLARQRPLPLFRKTSFAAAKVLDAAEPSQNEQDEQDEQDESVLHAKLVTAVAEGWRGGDRSRGDVEDAWIATFFVDYDPLDHLEDAGEGGLLGLARRVWVPVHRGLRAGGELSSLWMADSGAGAS